MGGDQVPARPWSARRSQNFVLSAILIVIGIALAVYYTWYFTIRDFGEDPSA